MPGLSRKNPGEVAMLEGHPEEIKSIRKDLKLTTGQFGEILGVSRRTVESWECGLRRPSKTALLLLERILADRGVR